MLKFLLYLLLIYVVVRFLFRGITGPVINVKTFNYNARPAQEDEVKKEGTVIIESQPKPKKGGNDQNLGEYVEYEEVK